ncbi:MAG TPA: hypothetical protein VH677_00595 [Nitrososphaera sp.]
MHIKTVNRVFVAAILMLSIVSIAVAARPAFAQSETLGQSWSSINSAVGSAESTFEIDMAGALAKVGEAEAKYDSVFRDAAFEVDEATGNAIDQAFVDIRAGIENNTKIDVVLNKQVIDKSIYKIAFMKIEQSLEEATSPMLAESMVDQAAAWFDVMTVKFKYNETPSEASEAMAELQANPDMLEELAPVVIDGLKAQFTLKVKEEVEEAVGALEASPPDTINAQKFTQEGIMYYSTIQPDVAEALGAEAEEEISHEFEELMEASAAADLEAAEHAAEEITTLMLSYEGKETTGLGGAIATMTDMLMLVDEEYGAAVADGAIVDQQEYDETLLFLERAVETFEGAEAQMLEVAPAETEEVEADLATIAELVDSLADPAEVTAVVEHALHELEEIGAAAGGSADFGANIEFIRGHLEMAIVNKNADNTELALAHAGHPVHEVYSLIEGPISEADESLNAELEEALTALANDIDTMAAADVESAVADINALLDDAMAAVAGAEAEEPAYWAHVIVLLLETAEVEYSEAVADGAIIEEIEYQDASAFIHRSEVAFEAIKGDMPEHEAEEVKEFYAELNAAVGAMAEREQVNTYLGGISHEMDEVFELGLEGGELDGWGYIDHIQELLEQVVHEYEEGNAQEARALAIEAYLDNYEFIEADIAEEDRPLMEKIEVDMRVELVQMIDAGAPLSEVEAHVEQIRSDLEVARAVTTPEFPVAALAASLGIAGTIAYARIRGLARRA